MANRFRLAPMFLAVLLMETAGATSTTWSGGALSVGRRDYAGFVRKGGPWARTDWRTAGVGEIGKEGGNEGG